MTSVNNINELSHGTSLQDGETTYQHARALRENYQLQINPGKTLSSLDYVLSLDLEPGLFNVLQKKRVSVNDNVYFIEIENKSVATDSTNVKWSIRRRYIDFLTLDKDLTNELVESKRMFKNNLPHLQNFYNSKVDSTPELFLQAVEKYLQRLLDTPEIRQKTAVLYDFLELSLLQLPAGTQKFKEGYLKKKSGGRFKHNKLKLYCTMCFPGWLIRWFILTEEGIVYTINSSSIKSREMILFDQSFHIEYGKRATGRKTGISLVTPNRRLNLQAKNVFECLDWVSEMKKAAKTSPYTKINRFLSFAPVREPVHNCKWYVDADGYYSDLCDALLQAKKEVFITDWWLTPELFLKKPVQEGDTENRLDHILGKIAETGVRVYVIVYHEVKMVMYNDSEHTKRALQKMSANITVLKHPSEPFFSWSHHEKLVVIDQTIGFIGGLDLCFGRSDTSDHPLFDPAFTEEKGETFPGQDYCNPRIVDFRNLRDQYDTPLIDKNSVPRMPFHDAMMKVIGPVVSDMCRHFIQYWNHVEIDCYGKEDEAPLPSTSMVPPKDEKEEIRESANIKFRNAMRKIVGMRQFTQIGKENLPPTPMAATQSEPASKHSLRKTQTTLPSLGHMDSARGSTNDIKDDIHVILHDKHEKKQELHRAQTVIKEEDEMNTSLDKWTKAKLKMQYQQSGPNPLTPKDNLLTGVENNPNAGLIVAPMVLTGVQTQTKLPKKQKIQNSRQIQTMNAIGQPRFMPGSEEDKEYQKRYTNLLQNIRKKEQDFQNEREISQTKNLDSKTKHLTKTKPIAQRLHSKISDQFYEKNMLQLLFTPKDKKSEGTIGCQMLRSASKWSLGLNAIDGCVENSIQNAYIELIQNAKSFIYIENQFFMSGTAGKVVKNEVGQALVYRIEKAHALQEKFRVLVFMPLLPAFEGEIIDSKAALLRIQIYWQYMTICRGGESIYEQLRNKGIRPEDYIQFYSLRTHARMPNGEPVTEMIYIHSKILIVDDDIALIGSANINDRSLQGSRDSEIAMVFDDTKKITSYMDGEEVKVGEYACTFRRRLLAEHMGLSEQEVMDPIIDEFTETLNETAEKNTQIYREIFACYPDDSQKTLKDIDESTKKKDLSKYNELIQQVKGHVVWYPLEFLSEEHLTAPKSSMEYYIPDQTFV